MGTGIGAGARERERGGKRERVTRERALCTRRTNLAEKGQ